MKQKLTSLILVVIVLMASLFTGCDSLKKEDVDYGGSGTVQLSVYDVGQGLAVLIECEGEYALYDAGDYSFINKNGNESDVTAFLSGIDTDSYKYVFASHYDSDHVGGLFEVLYNYTVDTLICPDYVAETDTYTNLQECIEFNGVEVVHPKAGDTFSLGSSTIEVLAPLNSEYEDENDYSVVIRVTHGKTAYIITGDATKISETEMVEEYKDKNIESHIYVVGHHGSSSSSSLDFLYSIKPDYAIISVGENEYGHPHEETLNNLKTVKAEIYRTDIDGSVVIESDTNGNVNITTTKSYQEELENETM